VNCALLCVKDDWKDSSEACAIACKHCAVYSVFPSGMMSHSKITQFNPYPANVEYRVSS
jgi:hypothetical protein